jgi:protein-disulfide isomerase
LSRKAERQQAARVVRDQLARERRRRRTLWTSVVVVAALVLAGLAGWGIYTSQRPDTVNTPPGTVDNGTAFTLGNGPIRIDVYEDFLCPGCGQFERASGSTLEQLAAQGKATVVYHPIAILDGYSTTGYSTRATAAAACAAPTGFAKYHQALFAQQPPEGGPGLSDDKLIEIGVSVGLTDTSFARCVRDGTYRSWAGRATEAASARGISGTPTVLVAGKQIEQPPAAALTAAVAAAGA